MAELHRKPNVTSEQSKDNQNAIMGDEEGVDGEIEEIEEVDTSGGVAGKPNYSELLSPTIRDVGGKDSTRKHGGSERRRHHRHHHSSHRDRRRRLGGQGDPEAEQYVSEEDGRVGSGRTKLRSENANHSNFEPDKNTRFSHRKNDRHGSHTRVYLDQPWSKQNMEDPLENGELSDSHEDPLAQTRYANTPTKRMTKDKKEHQSPLTGVAEAGEAEDGEILEDGELSDDETVASKDGESVSREVIEVSSASTLTGKEDGKSERHSRKRSEHKSKRKRDSDDKTRRKKHASADKMEAESSPAPAWGSGYQGPKPKTSAFHSKSHYGKGGRGYHSPPGLYDSPSYSEDSGEESLPKSLMTEGYIDASVAADEKEGIFNPKFLGKTRKRFQLDRNDRKRGRNFDGKSEGPPRKKLLSQAMSERPACKFYMEGKCAKGSNCQFNHDTVEKPRKMEVCKYHLTVKGCIKQRCLYMHEDYPCKYYHTGAKCYSGDRCKFSHDPLTDDTKRALEMRVAAEDIIDVEEMDYDYDYRSRESHSSPPRFRQDVKKIPSLFEIEVHPPGQSPKPSPQAARPSGFYNETTVSPKPGVAPNASAGAGGPGNNPNIGVMNNSAPANQPGLQNQGNMGGPGLLQTPLRPGNLIGGPMGNNRPNLIMGMNPQQQRPGGVAPIQFMGPRPMNSNQQGGNLPPVLNMLGAIIREAAMQKGPAGSNSNVNMGPNSGMVPILQNMQKNLGQGLNMLNSNNIQQGNMNIGPNMGNIMMPNNKGNMQPGNMGPLPSMMGPNSNIGNVGPNNVMGNANTTDNIGPNDGLSQSAAVNNVTASRNNIGQEVGNMDVDYRIKPDLIEIEETNKELSELDKIRQQLQAQIDKEEEDEGQEENEGKVQNGDDVSKTDEEQPVATVPDSMPETDDVKDDKAAVKTDAADVEQIEFPADLPKTQRELFKRIQQQQIIREKERKKQEALKVTEESETKAEDDDWYSSDDDEGEEDKPNLTDILKKLNQPLPAPTVGTAPSVPDSLNTSSSAPSTTSTFNIIQMINAIKNQTATKPTADGAEASASCKLSPPQSNQQKEVFQSSPASPPPVSTPISSLHLPQLTVDPPVVSAQPTKPLVYSVVKILLNIARPYSQLPDSVHASDQTFRDDPRVKWHINYLEKLQSKIPQKKEMSDGEKSQKQTDPRLKKGPSDPRLNKPSDGPNSNKVSDPRLQRAAVQSRPADPRLARQMVGNLDPRLSRQNSQNSADGIFLSGAMNNMGGGPMNAMGPGPMNAMGPGPMNAMGPGPMNAMGPGPMNAMGPGPMNAMGPGPMNAMGGVMNNQMGSSGTGMGVLMSSPGGSVNHVSGSMNNLLHNIGPVINAENQLNVVNPMNSPMGGPGRPFLGGGGGPLSNAMGVSGGPVNQNGGPFNPAGPGTNQMMRMGGPHGPGGSLGGGNTIDGQMGNIRGPLGQQNPVGNDPGLLDPRINNPSGARPGNQRPVIDPLSVNDPRLKNRLIDPREQRSYAKDPRSAFRDTPVVASSPSGDGMGDPGVNHANSDYKNSSRVPVDLRQSSNYSQTGLPSFGSSEHLKMLQSREECTQNSDHRIEQDEHLQLASSSSVSSTQYSDVDKPTRKFDHRNDPRFKRVKRLPGQTKSNMEYNSPLSSEDSPGDVNDGGGPDYNGYFHSRVNPSRDPRSRSTASPTLPDTLQDFDLPNSSTVIVVESELNLKVKDHFKTIDPTASPFC